MTNYLSTKLRTFLGEPMGEKCISFVDGVDKDLTIRLIERGYDKAYVLLGQFLLMHKKEDDFQLWLMLACGATHREAHRISICLREWCSTFL
ncbi:barrier-to-autointegration factor-like protein [Trichosurus vulpecula]|uniref:barrier-to-autointegration factor-like protein n=1 Tax=Trichosurus vulpecula TaxID=9337 RepID=UPI00186B2DF8|nr:barrier-to-autointegration factor-like protein [Trichosurus vulpecula]